MFASTVTGRYLLATGTQLEPHVPQDAFDEVNTYIDPRIERMHSHGFSGTLTTRGVAFQTILSMEVGFVSKFGVRGLVFTQLLPEPGKEGFALIEHRGTVESLHIYPVLLTCPRTADNHPTEEACDDAMKALLEAIRRSLH